MRTLKILFSAIFALCVATAAIAADVVKVGVFTVSSALPYFIALERGYFKEANIETQMTPLNSGPLLVQAMVSDQVDAVSNLVTLEGANINQRRPGTAMYISLNGQNDQYKMEQFIVRKGSTAKTLKDLKGAKILSAPGPANLAAAKAVLKSVGLEEGRDYTIQEQQMGVHVGALAAGTFDAGYTLEPVASIAQRQGVAQLLEAGVISTHLLGRRDALAFAAGGALTSKFIADRPDVAARYAAAWGRAVKDANTDPTTRELLVKHMNTSAELAPVVPIVKFVMTRDLRPIDYTDFQKFVDLGVEAGVVKDKVDVRTFLKVF